MFRRARKTHATRLPVDAAFTSGTPVMPVLERLLTGPVSRVESLNARGFLSLKVTAGGESFKVAECRSAAYAALAEASLQRVREVGGPVPEFLGREDAVIVVRWIEGAPCAREPLPRQHVVLLDCQQALHETPLAETARVDARYVHLETLSARFRKMAPAILEQEAINAILARLWERVPPGDAVSILHPDLTPANVVLSENGPVVIDNEAIAQGFGREFDVWHTAEALYGHRDERRMKQYVEAYQERCIAPALQREKSLWDDFRRLRRVMKAIEKRRLFKARRLLSSLRS